MTNFTASPLLVWASAALNGEGEKGEKEGVCEGGSEWLAKYTEEKAGATRQRDGKRNRNRILLRSDVRCVRRVLGTRHQERMSLRLWRWHRRWRGAARVWQPSNLEWNPELRDTR